MTWGFMVFRAFIAGSIIVCALFPSIAAAGTQTGKVLRVDVRASDGLIYFFLDGTASNRPACATHAYWMIADENSETGKRQLAMLLAARTSGMTVSVYGAGTCTRWRDGEDVNNLSY